MAITAKARKRKASQLDAARGVSHAFTDPAEVRAHLNALNELGFSWPSIGRATHRAESSPRWIAEGRGERVRGDIAAMWLAVSPRDVFAAADDRELVPAFAAARRLRALAYMGYRLEDVDRLALELGQPHPYAGMVTQQERIGAGRHRAVAAVFDRWQMTPGPSEQTRRRARREQYAPPLAWDEDTIDMPDAVPQLEGNPWGLDEVLVALALEGRGKLDTFADTHVACVRAWQAGHGEGSGAKLLGVAPRTFSRHVAAHRLASDPREAAAAAAVFLSPSWRPDANRSTRYRHATVVHLARHGLDVADIVARLREAGRNARPSDVEDSLAAYRAVQGIERRAA